MAKKSNPTIVVGSAAFFGGMEGFIPRTTDQITLVDEVPNGWWHHTGTSEGVRSFDWQRHTLEELVAKLRQDGDGKRAMTLLVPEFATAFGLDMEGLESIRTMMEGLTGRYAWGRTIYEAYLSNGEMTLTEEQRAEAYAQYKDSHGFRR